MHSVSIWDSFCAGTHACVAKTKLLLYVCILPAGPWGGNNISGVNWGIIAHFVRNIIKLILVIAMVAIKSTDRYSGNISRHYKWAIFTIMMTKYKQLWRHIPFKSSVRYSPCFAHILACIDEIIVQYRALLWVPVVSTFWSLKESNNWKHVCVLHIELDIDLSIYKNLLWCSIWFSRWRSFHEEQFLKLDHSMNVN